MPGLVRRDPALTVLKLCSTEAVYSSRLCKHATNQGASGSWLRDWFLEDYGRASERDRTSDLLITNQPAYHFNLLIIIHLDRLRNWLCSDCAHPRRCPEWVISSPSTLPAAPSHLQPRGTRRREQLRTVGCQSLRIPLMILSIHRP